jgi:hypothetical protein
VQFHFTPTGASWLNLVEVWFSLLTRKEMSRPLLKFHGGSVTTTRPDDLLLQ